MQKTKTKVQIRERGNVTFQDVDGYKFTYRGFDFVVHKSSLTSGWSVTEPQTGYSVITPCSTVRKTRKLAIKRAKETIDKYGVEATEKAIEQVMASTSRRVSNTA